MFAGVSSSVMYKMDVQTPTTPYKRHLIVNHLIAIKHTTKIKNKITYK